MNFELAKTNQEKLEAYLVNAKDQEYQIWERNSLSVECLHYANTLNIGLVDDNSNKGGGAGYAANTKFPLFIKIV